MTSAVELSRMDPKHLQDHADFLERELECTRALLRQRLKQEREREELAAAFAAMEARERREKMAAT